MRLSINNLAGTARTLVAVGTDNDASIDCTTRPATPRKGSTRAELGAATTGAGLTCGSAGVGSGLFLLFKTGCTAGCAGAATGDGVATGATGVTGVGAAALGVGGTTPFGAVGRALPTTELDTLLLVVTCCGTPATLLLVATPDTIPFFLSIQPKLGQQN